LSLAERKGNLPISVSERKSDLLSSPRHSSNFDSPLLFFTGSLFAVSSLYLPSTAGASTPLLSFILTRYVSVFTLPVKMLLVLTALLFMYSV
jgi:hypothetical protein